MESRPQVDEENRKNNMKLKTAKYKYGLLKIIKYFSLFYYPFSTSENFSNS
jgi:hypothetical protein